MWLGRSQRAGEEKQVSSDDEEQEEGDVSGSEEYAELVSLLPWAVFRQV